MFILILFILLFSTPSFANYAGMTAVKLDAGVSALSITNTGSVGGTVNMNIHPNSFTRLGIVFSPINVPPTSATTYTTCSSPCVVAFNRQWGQQYYWIVFLDSGGTPIVPFKRSDAGASYITQSCGSPGTLPQIEFPTDTTSPLPMPIEVIGQDCYSYPFQLPLLGGHASTSLQLWIRVHAPQYNNYNRWDGKIQVKVNNGSWINGTNANSNWVATDEMRFWSMTSNSDGTSGTSYNTFGGYAQVRNYTVALPDGLINGGDTTVTIRVRFLGTDGNQSGFRILEIFPIQNSHKTITQIVCTSGSCVATSTSHGYSSGDDVVIENAPDMRMVFNGPRHITAVTSNTFTFAPCGTGDSNCSAPDNTYTVPTKYDSSSDASIAQPVMWAARMLVAKSSFTTVDPTTWVAPIGADATRGGKLFKFGNAAGTAGQNDQLVNPLQPFLNNTLHNPSCGGAVGCHTTSGFDLKYYNFSNWVIKQRTIFHGFTEQDGDDIAAYIRNLSGSVPTKARPWNPPLQPGPGMDGGQFKRGDSSLVAIVVSSNTATAQVNSTSYLKTGDPIILWGCTVDTDLCAGSGNSKQYTITVTDSTHFTFTTSNVSNATYNESTLQLVMYNNVLAGCGVDCTLTYGYVDFLRYFAADTSKWAYNSFLDPKIIPVSWQFPDWKVGWLPPLFPADVFPWSNYLTNAAYTYVEDRLVGGANAITPGDFLSYKAAGYAANLYPNYSAPAISGNYFERNTGAGGVIPKYTDLAAAFRPPSIFGFGRQAVMQKMLMQQWEISQEYGALGMDWLRQNDLYGAATTTGCWQNFQIPYNVLFQMGTHKTILSVIGSILDGMRATYDYQSNIWYVAAPVISSGNCLDSPDNPIDNGYYQAFLTNDSQKYRPGGYQNILMGPIFAMQSGSMNTNFTTPGGAAGQDWTGFLGKAFPYDLRFTFSWFNAADRKVLADYFLDAMNSTLGAHDHTYWEARMTPQSTVCTGANYAWSQASPSYCDYVAMDLTLLKVWNADSTKLNTFLTWAKSITLTSWAAHDFDADISAASSGAPAGSPCSVGVDANYNFGDGHPKWWLCTNMQ